ncbi:MAG: YiiX/YebB-like N1pC/P60 family cysteine hydrolase [Methyloligellaceae bacterium]
MTFVDRSLDKIGRWLAHRLESEISGYEPIAPSDPETLLRVLHPGDILLIEGNQKISTAIKYLTQSTWSHAAMFIGDALIENSGDRPASESQTSHHKLPRLIEVNIGEGCVAVPLSKYQRFNTRICRPAGLTWEDRQTVIRFMIDRIGLEYDTRNIVDLMRYLFPTPPVPTRWRRRMLSLGSGEPTKAICSSLIAQAFQKVKYPILPIIERPAEKDWTASPRTYSRREILHIRHHSLYAPRDFDISPYFAIVKPTIETGFDYKNLNWGKIPKTSESENKVNRSNGSEPTIESEVQNVEEPSAEDVFKGMK